MDKSKVRKFSSFSVVVGVAFVWFTTHFGGGFASGAQMFAYFMPYGIWALIMPILAMGYNAVYYAYALHFARKHQLYDYRSYNDYFYGKYSNIFSNLFEVLYLVVMMLPPAVAFATGGATMAALTGLPYIICTLVIGVFIFIVAIFGTNIVRRVATALSVLIVGGLLAVYIPNIFFQWGKISNAMQTLSATSWTGDVFRGALYSAFIYGTFQLTNIAVLVQHAEFFEKPKDALKSNFIGWSVNILMLLLTVIGLFTVVLDPDITSVAVPTIRVVQNGVGSTFLVPLISILIILGAVSTAVNMVAAMTKRIQKIFEDPEITRAATISGRPTRISIIATLILCIIDFAIAQFGLIPLVARGYSFIAYLTIPIITIPYIVHMIGTNFDRKNPPRVVDIPQEELIDREREV